MKRDGRRPVAVETSEHHFEIPRTVQTLLHGRRDAPEYSMLLGHLSRTLRATNVACQVIAEAILLAGDSSACASDLQSANIESDERHAGCPACSAQGLVQKPDLSLFNRLLAVYF